MPDLSPILEHLSPLLLVASRLLGLFVFSPVLSSTLVPRQAKALFALAMSVAVYSTLPGEFHTIPATDLMGLAPILLSEGLIGISIGVIATLPLMAVQMAGSFMGHQMGLGLAEVFNPDTQANSAVIDQTLYMMGLATFVMLGGLEATFLTLMHTFERLPVGAFALGQAPADLFIAVLSSAFEVAIRIAFPVIGLIGLIMVSIGFVMRTIPQINIMTIGFSIKIIAGILLLAAAIHVVNGVLTGEIERVMGELLDWASTLAPEASVTAQPTGGVTGG